LHRVSILYTFSSQFHEFLPPGVNYTRQGDLILKEEKMYAPKDEELRSEVI